MTHKMVYYMMLLAVVCASCSPTTQHQHTGEPRPNVVVIYTDDMNFEDIRSWGGDVLTPNIDSLSNNGLRLENFYVTSAVCSPSRYSMLTGRYASKSKSLLRQFPVSDPPFLRWNVDIDEGDRTIAHVMKENGYFTGMVGKYHNFQNEAIQEEVPEDADMHDPEIAATIQRNYEKVKDSIHRTSGFDYLANLYANNLHALELPKSMQYHNMDWITQGALDFLDKTTDEPFFLYFPTTLPHAPAPIKSMHADAKITPSGLLDETPKAQPSREDAIKRVTEGAELPEEVAPYTWLDDAVGTIVNKLDSMGKLENTIILFASDHGGNRAKMTCYQKGVRVPAFIYWKGKIAPNSSSNAMTANIDFAPTIYDLCGIDLGEKDNVDGKSMTPLFDRATAQDSSFRNSLLLEITYSKAVVTDDWKYIAVRFPQHIQEKVQADKGNQYNQEGTLYSANSPFGKRKVRYFADELYPSYFDRDQLFDLNTDPDEQKNLFENPDYAQHLAEMKKLLAKYASDLPHAFGEFTADKK